MHIKKPASRHTKGNVTYRRLQMSPVNPTYTFLLEVIAHCHLPSNSSGLELTWTQSINVQYLCWGLGENLEQAVTGTMPSPSMSAYVSNRLFPGFRGLPSSIIRHPATCRSFPKWVAPAVGDDELDIPHPWLRFPSNEFVKISVW